MKSFRRVVLTCAMLAMVPVVAQAQEWPPEPVPPTFALVGGVNAPLPWDPAINDPRVIAIIVVDILPRTFTIDEGYDGFCERRYIGGLTFYETTILVLVGRKVHVETAWFCGEPALYSFAFYDPVNRPEVMSCYGVKNSVGDLELQDGPSDADWRLFFYDMDFHP